MFNKFGVGEIALILVALLLIFGPSKLPQLGKSIGESLREFKKGMKQVTDEVTAASTDEKKEPEKKG